jgi:hypothetical protein
MTYYPETIQSIRYSLFGLFKRKELKNPVTAQTVIAKLHQLHYRERYPFGIPDNLITPNKLVAIIKSSK